MIIPYEALSEDALQGLIEEFVTRDGTDYGVEETGLTSRVEQVKCKLKNGDVVVLYSEAKEVANLVWAEQLKNDDKR